MKQLVIVSGKGGTGKSTLAASLAQLIPDKRLADCDVETANLHLLLPHTLLQTEEYKGASVARIDLARCTACGVCRQVCRFDAISEGYVVDPLACEGCAACTVLCPTAAVRIEPVITGQTHRASTPLGPLAYARLEIGAEGSGKLVTQVRKLSATTDQGEPLTLIDGSPGIGCVVIASITGTDAVLAVAEATQSGLHDLKRVLAVARHFQVPGFVCINKWDLNPAMTEAIEAWCAQEQIPVLARIPFDPAVVKALKQGQTPVDAGIKSVTQPIRDLWQQLRQILAV